MKNSIGSDMFGNILCVFIFAVATLFFAKSFVEELTLAEIDNEKQILEQEFYDHYKQ